MSVVTCVYCVAYAGATALMSKITIPLEEIVLFFIRNIRYEEYI